MPPLNDLGDFGIFLSGVAAAIGVLAIIGFNGWKLYKSIKGEARTAPASPVASAVNTTGPLLIFEDSPAYLKLKLYLAELAQHNRHDARNALGELCDTLTEMHKEHHREVTRALERLADELRRG